MNLVDLDFLGKSRRRALCDHFAMIEDPRVAGGASVARSTAAYPPRTIGDCIDDAAIAAWDKAHPSLPRRYPPDHTGVPGARRLTIRITRIDPGLFSEAFPSWVREDWPDRPEFVAIDAKTSRWKHFAP